MACTSKVKILFFRVVGKNKLIRVSFYVLLIPSRGKIIDTAFICQVYDAWADSVSLESCLHLSESDISYNFSVQMLEVDSKT